MDRPQTGRTSPPSPTTIPLSRQLSARLQNVWRGNRASVATTVTAGAEDDDGWSVDLADAETLAEDIEERRRSVSRGREAFKSTGRGGAGNIHASPSVGPDNEIDYSPSRGREVDVDPDHAKSSGRGGLGNIRSRSRAHSASVVPEGFPQTASIVSEGAANAAAYEQRVIEEAAKPGAIHSSGRGGAGNISGSRSRSRGPSKFFGGGDAKLHSTGRGGAGNLQSSDLQTLDSRQEADLYGPFSEDGVHSTGRGGRANIVNAQSPPLEPLSPHAQAYENSGRGGAGNIRSARSKSRDPTSPRSRSRDPISRIWQKVTHAHAQAQAQRQDIQEEPAPAAHAHGGGGAAHRQRALLRRVGSPGFSLFEHEDRVRSPSPSHASLNTLTTSASTSSLTTLSSYDPPATPPPFSFPQPSSRAHLLSPPTSPLSPASAYGAPTHDKFTRSAPSLRSLQSLPTLHEDLETRRRLQLVLGVPGPALYPRATAHTAANANADADVDDRAGIGLGLGYMQVGSVAA